MIDVCCAPMPFVVGVHASSVPQLRRMPLEHTVFVDLDAHTVIDNAASAINAAPELDDGGVGDDGELPAGGSALPSRHTLALRQALERAVRERRSDNDSLAKPFLYYLAAILANYSKFVVLNLARGGESDDRRAAPRKHVFALQRFIRLHPSRSCRQFLARFCPSQMFEQFIDERLERLEQHAELDSEFDQLCDLFLSNNGDLSVIATAGVPEGAPAEDAGGTALKQRVASFSMAAGQRLKKSWQT